MQNTLFQSGKSVLIALLAGLSLVVSGCSKSAPPADPPTAGATAEAVLRAMIDAYAGADSYEDRAVVRLRYRVGSRWSEDTGKLSLKFERPNRLALEAYQLRMSCDGERLQATIQESGSGPLDRQVLTLPAPSILDADDVYADPMVLNLVGSGMGGPPVTLELLTSDDPLQEAFADGGERALLGQEDYQGHSCHRVQVRIAEGSLILWVDTTDYVLRRLEYPTEQLVAQMQQSVDCREVTLTVDFRDARINIAMDDSDFRFAEPPSATHVSRFVIPPKPLPSTLLGKKVDDFYFTDLQDGQITRESLLTGPLVLVWFNNHPASQACLEQLSRVERAFQDDSDVRFLAVCTEPTLLSHRQIQSIVARWGVAIDTARDLEAFGRDVFQIPWAPTLVVLDEQGTIQWFEVGANPLMQEELPNVLNRLLAGEDVATATLKAYESQQRAYQAALTEVAGPDVRQAKSAADGTDY